MPSLTVECLIPPALWVALAVATASLLAWYSRRRPGAAPRGRWAAIIALMALGTADALAILLNPTWIEPITPPAGKPLLTVLVDQSASMAVEDAVGGKSRWIAASELAAQAERDLSSRFDVEVRTFSETLSAASSAELANRRPDGQSTNLSAGLAGALATDRPQGQAIHLISDGIHNAPGGIAPLADVLRLARAMDAPIYTTTLGGATSLRDLEVSVIRPQEVTFVGQRVPISIALRQRGSLIDSAEVVLLHDGKEVAREIQPIAADGRTALKFHVVQNQSGLYRYDVRVEPHAAEATDSNNMASFLVRVVDQPVRVLLLEGKPYWDGKFLIRTLAADPSLEVDAIVRIAENRFVMRNLKLDRRSGGGSDPGVATGSSEIAGATEVAGATALRIETSSIVHDPQTLLSGPQGLDGYQLVVLGRDAEAFLSPAVLERLRTWISRDGGSLICYRGTPVAQVPADLARLMPVRWSPARESRFRVKLTDRGNDLSWLNPGQAAEDDVFNRMPSLATTAPAESPKPLSVVLARSEADAGPAVVTYQSYGTGRVVAVEGSGMWRWAFLSPQYQQHDQVYGSLWQSLLRWLVSSVGLVPGQDLMLRTDKVTYSAGETVAALLLTRDESAGRKKLEVELTAEGDGSTRTVTAVPLGEEPGVYRVPFGVLPEGAYRARVTGSAATSASSSTSVAFDVRSISAEQLDVQARPDLMARIAEQSGGSVLDANGTTSLSDRFREHLARSRPEKVRRIPAWDRWWVLVGMIAVWGTAWSLRRSAGLV
jgi:hypothetical protein